jgi:hypothetical protein
MFVLALLERRIVVAVPLIVGVWVIRRSRRNMIGILLCW